MLGVICELLFVKKELFSGGKHKFLTACDAFERPIPEVHHRLSES
jgi:hypothetical protein